MEFPEAGAHCNVSDCKLLDFLPIKCIHCKVTFCKDHSTPSAHSCPNLVDNVVTEKKTFESYKCSSEDCKTTDLVEMICRACRKHYCLGHTHHGCFDKTPHQSKRDKIRAPKQQFRKAKAETDKYVQEKLKNAQNRVLANKIKLMKIKGSAVGDNRIPTVDRIFFSVAPPLCKKDTSHYRNIFVSKNHTIGKCINTFAKRLNVDEGYDTPESPKLRLFDLEGQLIPGALSELMSSLLESGIIIDGDSLILEYVPAEDMDNDSYDKLKNKEMLAKYIFV